MRRLLLLLALCACERPSAPTVAVPRAVAREEVASTLPNIVVIFTDDMRTDILPYLPNVQKYLVDSGVTFTKAFDNSPLCCPSRASLLTGTMQHTHQVLGNTPPLGGAQAFNDQTTIATDLKARGYVTAMVGKYLNGYGGLGTNYVPPGWDEWRVYKQPHYQSGQLVEKAWDSTTVHTNSYSGYTPGVLRQKVANFLQRAPVSSPVFLLFTPYAPHREVQPVSTYPIPSAQDAGKCAAIQFPAWSPAFNEANVSDKPAYVQSAPLLTATQRAQADTGRIKQCESLLAVDRTVGDIVTVLSATGRLANTLIVFATDNGYLLGEHRLFERKAAMYDEAIRTPFVVRGLGARLGVVDTNLVQVIDLSATIRAVAGLPISQAGRDLRSTMANGGWTTDAILVEMTNSVVPQESFAMVRTHDFAYAEYPQGGPGGGPFAELYDLTIDPSELVNRATDPLYVSTVQQLRGRLTMLQLLP